MRNTSGFSSRLGRAIATSLDASRDTQGPFLVATGILGFLSIFKRSQAASPVEAWNFAYLSICQRDVRRPVKMRRGTWAFSVVCTVDSHIPSSWEMQDEPAFKSLQGNLALLQVRASRCPFKLRPHTQCLSHITIAERCLFLRCLWKGGIHLESKSGNQLSSRVDLWYTELFFVAVLTSGSL